jgi:hypothetical protein
MKEKQEESREQGKTYQTHYILIIFLFLVLLVILRSTIVIYNTTSSPNDVDYFSNRSRIINCAWE